MNAGIKQHQRLARSGGDPQEHTNFGVAPANATHKPHSEPKGGRVPPMKDGKRGIGTPKGFHPAPDHGNWD